MKLELKHIAPYLPYGLKVVTPLNYNYGGVRHFASTIEQVEGLKGEYCSFIGLPSFHPIQNFKPILRHVGDLINETTINGESFIPIEELAKISDSRCGFRKTIKKVRDGYFYSFSDVNNNQYAFAYFVETKSFLLHSSVLCSIGNSVYPSNQYDMFQKLLEWHFDVFGLIDKGLAIDINTIKQ